MTWMKQYLPKVLVKRWWIQDCGLLLIAPGAVAVIAALTSLSFFQSLEWSIYDSFFQLRSEERADDRVVVVTIDDDDFQFTGQAPISDETLASLLMRLQQEGAGIVGLDMYRDLPVQPGQEQLEHVFQNMPNLIGIKKISSSWGINAPKSLQEKDQVAVVDVLEDPDLTVRRGLISIQDNGKIYLTLGARVALDYLRQKGIRLQAGDRPYEHVLGKALFQPFKSHDGGYVAADAAGYQVLLNYRGDRDRFQTISLSQVLDNNIPEGLFQDRIVLIGTTAKSQYDFFSTPYSESGRNDSTRMPGVFIHANLASQMISGALDGRPFIQTLSNSTEWVWALGWSLGSVFVSGHVLKYGRFFGVLTSYLGLSFILGGILLMMMMCSYIAFLMSLWIPIVPAGASVILSGLTMVAIYGHRLHQLAYRDGLTKVYNRRYFDQILTQRIQLPGYLSIILCDVDHFKLYNDTYGHLAGDACLQKVASAIKAAVRRSDSVARYGGEEFVVMLPATPPDTAFKIAEAIVCQIRSMNLPHESSKTAEYVTLSCGVTSVLIDDVLLQRSEWNAEAMIASADQGLYQAKDRGRDRAIVKTFNLLPSHSSLL